jgi:hypothetical protein
MNTHRGVRAPRPPRAPRRYLRFPLLGVPRFAASPIDEIADGRDFDQLPVDDAADILDVLGAYQWIRAIVVTIAGCVAVAISKGRLHGSALATAHSLTLTVMTWLPVYMVCLGLAQRRLKSAHKDTAPISERTAVLRFLRLSPVLALAIAAVMGFLAS